MKIMRIINNNVICAVNERNQERILLKMEHMRVKESIIEYSYTSFFLVIISAKHVARSALLSLETIIGKRT